MHSTVARKYLLPSVGSVVCKSKLDSGAEFSRREVLAGNSAERPRTPRWLCVPFLQCQTASIALCAVSAMPKLHLTSLAAGILGLLPVSSYAATAETSGGSPKPVILESGLAYVDKKTKDGLLASVEQKVGQVTSFCKK